MGCCDTDGGDLNGDKSDVCDAEWGDAEWK